MRNPTDGNYQYFSGPIITNRGFTMHEHMDQFKLINMNGRVYDPVLAQFLSPDPFVTGAASTMSYNRYAYCNYNPLKYVDPSGYRKTNRYLGGVQVVNAWPLDMRRFAQDCMMRIQSFGSSNPNASMEAAFKSEHTKRPKKSGGWEWVANDKLDEDEEEDDEPFKKISSFNGFLGMYRSETYQAIFDDGDAVRFFGDTKQARTIQTGGPALALFPIKYSYGLAIAAIAFLGDQQISKIENMYDNFGDKLGITVTCSISTAIFEGRTENYTIYLNSNQKLIGQISFIYGSNY